MSNLTRPSLFLIMLLIATSCSLEQDKTYVSEETASEPRIVGGNDARENEYKFFTLLMREAPGGRWQTGACGASLVDACWVLTAGHCVYDTNNELIDDGLGVYVNAWMPYDGNGGHPRHVAKVAEVIPHPSYDPESRNQKHDMALLRLEQCADSIYTPTQLAAPSMERKGDFTVIGLGHTVEGGATATTRVLQEAVVPFIDRNVCNQYYSNSGFTVFDDMLCAGYEGGQIDSCQGDSGGPLVRHVNNHPYQFGVVSWGIGCARARRPGVYSSVGYHFDWLKGEICDQHESQLVLCGDDLSGGSGGGGGENYEYATVAKLEAEDGENNSLVLKWGADDYSGTGYVNFGSRGSYVEWSEVNISEPGEYRIQVVYYGPRKSMNLIIKNQSQNLGEQVSRSFLDPNGAPTEYKWLPETIDNVSLKGGTYSIRIEAAEGSTGSRIDYILVEKRVEAGSSFAGEHKLVSASNDQCLVRLAFLGMDFLTTVPDCELAPTFKFESIGDNAYKISTNDACISIVDSYVRGGDCPGETWRVEGDEDDGYRIKSRSNDGTCLSIFQLPGWSSPGVVVVPCIEGNTAQTWFFE